ncbi:hypothetical protein EF912_17485 [Streptomyces sp. WAC07061]|uniref:hypothetical protein n=1 Tax=Streptomyces sp. WAC07061 TaxID=2487410 RepID=UPI000F7774F6|nr:hypothetical protein [Streptomyces sp. WAC07061]RSS53687.1 hypothetical protein EF912_17485 [Streptomyces sp. WAC07061]
MHRGTGLLTRHGLALAVCAAAAVLTGCGSGGEGKDDSPARASSSASAPAATATRDSVEADIVAALRKAGVDPAVGKSTPVRNGAKRPDAFDWMGVLRAPDAEPARVAAGAELERLGWRKVSERGTVHRYEKGEWSLLAGAMGAERLPSLPEGTGMLSFTATKLDGDAA